MSHPNPLLADDAPLEVLDARGILAGPAPRRRGTAHLLRLDSGRVLLAYTIRRPQPTGMIGALMLTRSDDEGASWEEPFPLLAMPGSNAYAMSLSRISDDRLRLSLGRVTVDRSLGGDEPFSDWWSGEVESRDGGETWSAPGPELTLFPYWTEMYGPSNPHPLADGRLLWITMGTVGRDEGWRVGVTVTDAEGSAYGPVTLIAAAPDRNFADSDLARLRDGRFVAVMREMATRQAFMAFSDDEGATWSQAEPAGFRGANIRLQPLQDGSVLCAYRDEDPQRHGVSVSVSDDGRSWRWIGQLYRGGPDARHEPTLYCGYPAFARLAGGDLLCVLHTYVDDAGRGNLHQSPDPRSDEPGRVVTPVARRTRWRIEKDSADVANGAVASENAVATDVGVAILRRGGNAVDAAVATAFALAVVEPAACGLGGGGVLLLDGPGRAAPVAIEFAMTAPRAAAGAYELVEGIGSSRFGWRKVRGDANVHGPSAAATPGFVAGLDVALRTFGTMSLADVLAPSIRLAERGVEVAWPNTLRIAARLRTMARYPETLAIFAPDGFPLTPGGAYARPDRLVQRDLGRTLRALARGGAVAFHEGEVAEALDRWSRRSGCLVSGFDLAAYRPAIHDAAQATTLGAWEVHEIAGPSGCFTAQQALNIVDRLWTERERADDVQRLDLIARASRASFADRRQWSRAQSDGDIPYAALIGARHAARQAAEVERERASEPPAPARGGRHGPGYTAESTSHLIAVDRDRTVVSLTATLADNFGSAVVVPGTGILLNNAMQWFNPEPGTAMSIASGRRGLHNMTPLVVRRNGRPVLAVGSAGGVRILDAVAQIVLNATLRGMPVGDAIAEPRIDASGDALLLDARLPRRVQRGLAALGHDVRAVEDSIGGHQFSRPIAVAIDHARGRIVAAVDPLRPGVGAGY